MFCEFLTYISGGFVNFRCLCVRQIFLVEGKHLSYRGSNLCGCSFRIIWKRQGSLTFSLFLKNNCYVLVIFPIYKWRFLITSMRCNLSVVGRLISKKGAAGHGAPFLLCKTNVFSTLKSSFQPRKF